MRGSVNRTPWLPVRRALLLALCLAGLSGCWLKADDDGELDLVPGNPVTGVRMYGCPAGPVAVGESIVLRFEPLGGTNVAKVVNVDARPDPDDGTIEAVELASETFVLGVQWHPEEMPDDPLFARLLDHAHPR